MQGRAGKGKTYPPLSPPPLGSRADSPTGIAKQEAGEEGLSGVESASWGTEGRGRAWGWAWGWKSCRVPLLFVCLSL